MISAWTVTMVTGKEAIHNKTPLKWEHCLEILEMRVILLNFSICFDITNLTLSLVQTYHILKFKFKNFDRQLPLGN